MLQEVTGCLTRPGSNTVAATGSLRKQALAGLFSLMQDILERDDQAKWKRVGAQQQAAEKYLNIQQAACSS